MGSTVTHITCETLDGVKVFIVRQFNSVAEIGVKTPVDIWESYDIVADTETVNYLMAVHEAELAWETAMTKPE